MEGKMIFQVTKIHNGWNIQASWTEPGGGEIPPQPRLETLYCKEMNEIANVMVVWAKDGFEAAFQTLQAILTTKEAKRCQKDTH